MTRHGKEESSERKHFRGAEMKKRISVILLALCMALFLLPAQAFADDSPSVVEIDVGGG